MAKTRSIQCWIDEIFEMNCSKETLTQKNVGCKPHSLHKLTEIFEFQRKQFEHLLFEWLAK